MNVANVYRVETVEPCDTPRGVTGGKWCRYVVTNKRSRIIGRCLATLPQARRDAKEFADGLNDRTRNGASPWSPRRKRAVKAKQTKQSASAAAH
jgi:hypothetical protein